jgi:cysteine desulfurase
MKRVYLDHNATSPMRAEVRACFLELLEECSGNASSVHASGRRARVVLDQARERVAAALEVHEDEILFTSGGTESNNLALLGTLRPRGPAAGLVTTAGEHSSVLGAARALEEEGHPVRYAGVDEQGVPRLAELRELAARPDCALVSVVLANNEVGALAPLAELARGLAELPPSRRPRLHTDAVQALGKVPLDLHGWQVDLASFSPHKLGGPLGTGVLFRRSGVVLGALVHGGGQELDLRPGTENVPAIGAAALAIELAVAERADFAARAHELLQLLFQEVRRALPGVALLGPPLDSPARLPNTINVLVPHVDGRVLVTRLDLAGLEASAGSACASGSLEPSHVLLAMGLSREDARAGLRLSLGRGTTHEDIHIAVEILRRTLVDAT